MEDLEWNYPIGVIPVHYLYPASQSQWALTDSNVAPAGGEIHFHTDHT